MKIGISLAGVSYSTNGRRRDFRQNYENFFETIYFPLNIDHEVSVYTTTYNHELSEELLKAYKPIKYQFIPFEGSNPRSTYMHSLCLIEEENLDIMLCTRFDIKFNQKITTLNVDYNKFNFLFKEKNMWDSHKFVTDNFFLFPVKYFYEFADSIEELTKADAYPPHTFMHHIYGYVENRIGIENINFMCGDEQGLSHANRFYELTRTEI